MSAAEILKVEPEPGTSPVLPLGESIRVPAVLLSVIDQLIEQIIARTGETPGQARRAVELAVLNRGVAEVQREIEA